MNALLMVRPHFEDMHFQDDIQVAKRQLDFTVGQKQRQMLKTIGLLQ